MTDSAIRPARTPTRRYVAVATVAVSAAAFVVVAPTAGHAVANACTVTPGRTSNLAVGPNGPHPTNGTIWTKQPPGCLDFNLIRVSAGDQYEGWLENTGSGKWTHCLAGFRSAPPLPQVLCKSVATGTPMAVVQASATQRNVTMEY